MGFQPSDLAKLVLVIYVARMLVHKKEVIKDFKLGIAPILWPIVIICGLILPADFSTAAMLFIVCFIMLFVGGAKLKHLSAMIGVSIAGFSILILLNLHTHLI